MPLMIVRVEKLLKNFFVVVSPSVGYPLINFALYRSEVNISLGMESILCVCSHT